MCPLPESFDDFPGESVVTAVLVGLFVVKYLLIGTYKGVVSAVRRLRRWRDARAERRALATTMGS